MIYTVGSNQRSYRFKIIADGFRRYELSKRAIFFRKTGFFNLSETVVADVELLEGEAVRLEK